MAKAETALIIEELLTTDRSAAVIIMEAADKYLPLIDSLTIQLANGQAAKATSIKPEIAQKVEETRQALKREDRIMWALRFYKKSLVYELLWLCRNDPEFMARKLGAPPAPQQPQLERQLQKLADIDITPFQEHDPNDPEDIEPPYTGFGTIDAINEWVGGYIAAAQEFAQGRFQEVGADQTAQLDQAFVEKYKRKPGESEQEPLNLGGANYERREGRWWKRQYRENLILNLVFERQSFGEIVSIFRRQQLFLEKRFRGTLEITPNQWRGEEGDLRDKEGPIETIVKFPNGWRWLNLHRTCSQIRNDLIGANANRDPKTQVTGHCCNVAAPHEGDEVLELVEPMGTDRWRHHACFILNTRKGVLGEMKGRANQKPSPRLFKYIFELLRQYKPIQGLAGTGYGEYGGAYGLAASGDFQLKELPPQFLEILKRERPELWQNSTKAQLPDEGEEAEREKKKAEMRARIEQRRREREQAAQAGMQQGQGGAAEAPPVQGHIEPPQEA